jgi:hypothetical protein
MEKSELDNYWGLWRSGMLGIPAVVLLSFWSLLKYVRRWVVSALAR